MSVSHTELLALMTALADESRRGDAARALADRVGAAALYVLVEDDQVDALLPVVGLRQTLAGGADWRALLTRCREPGLHHGEIAHPAAPQRAPALACCGAGLALIFVGDACQPRVIEAMLDYLPLLSAALRAQQALVMAAGEAAAARADARQAAALATSLDAARADLQRHAISLADARARAEEATRAKDEFLALLGHELRNPLAPMTTAIELMRLDGRDSRELDILARHTRQLTRLVDDLLDVSRIVRGQIELRLAPVELAQVIAQAVEMASPLLEAKHQRLDLDVPTRGLCVEADAARLAQVFANLLTNAARYSPEGSPVNLTARHLESHGTIEIRVVDHGIGIEPEMLSLIFERFHQAPRSLDRAEGGLGLGLAIVKHLVSLHHGDVNARSAGLGQGSEFTVTLPASSRDPAPSAPRPDAEPIQAPSPRAEGDGVRVLIVDDNADAAELTAELLRMAGYDVQTAHDGPSGLTAADRFQPHVCVLDIGLPVIDGYELAQRLRNTRGETSLGLIALTGYGQASDKARATQAGFDAHLVKPIDIDTLERVVAELANAVRDD